MVYQLINGTLAGQNVMYMFAYANSVTNYLFVLMMLIAFFVIVLVSSLVFQIRLTSRVRPEVSFLAASFASLGMCVILAQYNGLISVWYYVIFIALTIVSFAWVSLSSGE